jgi:NDP-sugar pyrophosphorylase family protein
MKSGLIAGIIAAGEGSRLRSEGISLPKPLVPVDGVPLIERLLNIFVKHGIREVACIVNEYSLEVKEFVESKRFGVPVHFIVKTTPSSMHSLFALAPLLKDGRFLLSTVDSIFFENEFDQFLKAGQQRSSADGVLAVTKFIDDENPLYAELDASNRIVSFRKSGIETWTTGGLYIFSPRIFRETETALRRGVERLRNFLGFLLEQGYVLEGFPFSKIVDVDHAHDIVTAENLLRTA